VSFWGEITVLINFTKNRDDESYYVVLLLVDIETYIESRLHFPRKPDDIELKETAEEIIVKAFKKKKFVHSRPPSLLLEGEAGKNMALVEISSIGQTLAEVEKHVSAFNLDMSMNERETLKALLLLNIRKLKKDIERLERQALAIVEESASA
jgi:hypothetical protein